MCKAWLTVLLLLTMTAGPSVASDLTSLSQAFHKSCLSAAAVDLAPVAALNTAAGLFASGHNLDQALFAAGYRASNSLAIEITGAAVGAENFTSTARNVFAQQCQIILDEGLLETGSHRIKGRFWLVLARPQQAMEQERIPELQSQLLTLVNAVRAEPRRCGSQAYRAARAVRKLAASQVMRDRASHKERQGLEMAAFTGIFRSAGHPRG